MDLTLPTEQELNGNLDRLVRYQFIRKVFNQFMQFLVITISVIALFTFVVHVTGADKLIPVLIRTFVLKSPSDGLISFGLTIILFVSTIFIAVWIKIDLTKLLDVHILIVLSIITILTLASIVTLIFPKRLWIQFICSVIVLLIVMLILAISAQLIVGDRQYEFAYDTYTMATFLLYCDMIAIFFYTLPNVLNFRHGVNYNFSSINRINRLGNNSSVGVIRKNVTYN